MVFAFDHYYPSGGMKDFKGDFEFSIQAETFAKTLSFDYIQIYDIVGDQIEYIDNTDDAYGGPQ